MLTSLLLGLVIGCAAAPRSDSPSAKPVSKVTSGAAVILKGNLGADYRQGLSYIDQGQFRNAQEVFEALAQAYPERMELHAALGILYKRQGLLEKAIGAYQRAVALSSGTSAGAVDPSRQSELYNNLAIAYREHGEFKKAEDYYRKAIALNPKFGAAFYNLGVLYDLYLNRPAEAIRFYKDYERLVGKNETVDIWIMDLESRALKGAENAE